MRPPLASLNAAAWQCVAQKAPLPLAYRDLLDRELVAVTATTPRLIPEEELLVAAVKVTLARPEWDVAIEGLGMAVYVLARRYAHDAPEGSPAAKPAHWYEQGAMA